MIKQFSKRIPSASSLRDAEWPLSPDRSSEIFEPRKSYRKLNVLIDAHLIARNLDNTEKPSKGLLLLNLLNHDLIQYYRYSDSGPDIKPVALEGHKWLEGRVYEGWAVAFPFEKNGELWPVTYARSKTSFINASVNGNAVQLAKKDESSPHYRELESGVRAEKRKLDMLAHEVADQAIQADIFITDRAYLLEGRRLKVNCGLTVCSSDDAISLLSLYLRAQGEYIISIPTPHIHRSDRGLFYWVGTREVLPESWRWSSACVLHSSASGEDKLLRLGGSVLSRVQRSLQARDRVHLALNRITDHDINDDALGNLDHVFMLLMGAVDASARVAHHVLGLTTQERYAGWQNDGWIRQVGNVSPGLATLFSPESPHSSTLQILRLLRNSVHGEALQGATFSSRGKRDTIMHLPKSEETLILLAMDALGGRNQWGYHPFAGYSNIHPALLVDMLMEHTTALLNDVMKETPIERLSGIEAVSIADQSSETDDNTGLFSEWNRLTIRWQLGL